jgi:hypothetical protein
MFDYGYYLQDMESEPFVICYNDELLLELKSWSKNSGKSIIDDVVNLLNEFKKALIIEDD